MSCVYWQWQFCVNDSTFINWKKYHMICWHLFSWISTFLTKSRQFLKCFLNIFENRRVPLSFKFTLYCGQHLYNQYWRLSDAFLTSYWRLSDAFLTSYAFLTPDWRQISSYISLWVYKASDIPQNDSWHWQSLQQLFVFTKLFYFQFLVMTHSQSRCKHKQTGRTKLC